MPRTAPGAGDYAGPVLDLSSLDLGEIATALADQTGYEHRWLINPQTGEIVFWTSDTGIDGQTPVDLDELDLICIDPLPSSAAQPSGSPTTRSSPTTRPRASSTSTPSPMCRDPDSRLR